MLGSPLPLVNLCARGALCHALDSETQLMDCPAAGTVCCSLFSSIPSAPSLLAPGQSKTPLTCTAPESQGFILLQFLKAITVYLILKLGVYTWY